MFCPQCGQQQVSDEVRFCSRCGFQLGMVTSLLSTGGAPLPNLYPNADGPALQESPRRRGVRYGVMMFFLGMVLTPVLAIVLGPGPPNDFPGLLIPLSAVVLFLGGFLRMIYALVFEEGPLRKKKQPAGAAYVPTYAPPAQFGGGAGAASALPPGQSVPARSFMPPRGSTSEMPPPSSVTESTTQLLDDEANRRTR